MLKTLYPDPQKNTTLLSLIKILSPVKYVYPLVSEYRESKGTRKGPTKLDKGLLEMG